MSDFHVFNILLNLTDKNIIKFTKTLSDAHPHPGTCTFSIIVLFWISLIFFIFFSLSLSLALFLSRPASVSARLSHRYACLVLSMAVVGVNHSEDKIKLTELFTPDTFQETLARPLAEGDIWYLVDSRWFKQCRKYLGFNEQFRTAGAGLQEPRRLILD